jgi:glycerol uptake facilitator-like aquaporin
MNPAVSLANAVVSRLPWKRIPFYWTAQMLGAIVASACVYGVYYGRQATMSILKRCVYMRSDWRRLWATKGGGREGGKVYITVISAYKLIAYCTFLFT